MKCKSVCTTDHQIISFNVKKSSRIKIFIYTCSPVPLHQICRFLPKLEAINLLNFFISYKCVIYLILSLIKVYFVAYNEKMLVHIKATIM